MGEHARKPVEVCQIISITISVRATSAALCVGTLARGTETGDAFLPDPVSVGRLLGTVCAWTRNKGVRSECYLNKHTPWSSGCKHILLTNVFVARRSRTHVRPARYTNKLIYEHCIWCLFIGEGCLMCHTCHYLALWVRVCAIWDGICQRISCIE